MKKTFIWLSCVLVAILVIFGILYVKFSDKPDEGKKNVTITVIDSNGESTEYKVKTNAKYLKEAMDDAEGLTFSGKEGAYGMMVQEVNGMSAVYDEDGAYWAFSVNGKYCANGIDTQIVKDGDSVAITYTTAK